MPSRFGISEAASLGLHTMAVLASRPGERCTNRELADCLRASGHHLAKVMQRLSRAGLVDAVVGPKGGFTLGKPADEIRLLEIYEVVDGPLDTEGCLLREPLCDGEKCVLGDVIQSVNKQLRECLAKTTLAELAQGVAVRKSLVDVETEEETSSVV
jgi:Rrf2 family protein